jgi:4-hydroxybenzoate polyprenyltransferase/phosphoserine phosphatase
MTPGLLPPLVVDLDGTLTPTDTLAEAVVRMLRARPWLVLHLLVWLLAGRAGFKARVAALHRLNVASLPWRQDFLDWLRMQRDQGRPLVLATAAHRTVADDVAAHLGLFTQVLASDVSHNLKGSNKLAAITSEVGPRFSYAGDSSADLPIWQAAESAVLVGASPVVARRAAAMTGIEMQFERPPAGLRVWLRAARMHQWVKNLLIFVPLFTSFQFMDPQALWKAVLAFVALSLAASGTYILNDLWDLDSDRQHARKRLRPFASGAIPIARGVFAALLLMTVAVAVGAALSAAMAGAVVLYIVLTTLYSLMLKHYVIIDVLMLALLYTLRLLVGSVATGIVVTPWLLAFSVFLFFSLALVKRCAELVALGRAGASGAKGRDYQVSDLAVLWPLGVGAGLCAVVVFGLYIGSSDAQSQYRNAAGLWLAGVGLIYWVARLWVKTARGEMHDDPIVFALRDFGSRVTILTMLGLVLAAHFLD